MIALLVLGFVLFSTSPLLIVRALETSEKYIKPTYVEAVVGKPETFNPLFSRLEAEREINNLVFRGLTKISPQGLPEVDLASSVEIKGETEYIFKLKRDVFWHDGNLFNADDVIYTIKTAQNPIYQSEIAASFKDVIVKKIDDFTVSFKLKEPFAPFLIATTVGIIPEHIPLNNYRPIGTGAHKFIQIKDNFSQLEGKNNKISFRYYPTSKDAQTALKLGEVHALVGVDSNEVGVESWKNLKLSEHILPFRLVTVFFNTKSEFLKDDTVRRALSYATPKEEIVKNGGSAKGKLAVNSLPGLDLIQNNAKERYPFNLERAAALLTSSGWVLQEGFRVKDNQKLKLTITTIEDKHFEDTAAKLRAAWKKLGLDVSVVVVSGAQLQDQIVPNRQFEVLLTSQLLQADADQYVFWHTTQTNFANISGLSSPKVDKLLEDGRRTLDPKVRAEKYSEFNRLLLDEAPAVFLYYPKFVWIHSKRIGNIKIDFFSEPQDRFNRIDDWTIKRSLI